VLFKKCHGRHYQNFPNMLIKISLSLFCSICIAHFTFAQKIDSARNNSYISGAVGITNNGISLIPTFSLDGPAAIFNMSIGKSKFSFDPEFTFSLKGKPWYFLFWFRYKLVNTAKFRMTAGTHLGLNFKNIVLPINNDSSEVIFTERYVVGELVPTYSISKNISVGIYYLYSHGIDPTSVNNTHFMTVNANFSNIKLINRFYMNIIPQFYYLKQGKHDGFYFTSAFVLARSDLPFSLSSVVNKEIHSDILGSEDFVWNITLTYSFHRRYLNYK
jgi:hypothetical protein